MKNSTLVQARLGSPKLTTLFYDYLKEKGLTRMESVLSMAQPGLSLQSLKKVKRLFAVLILTVGIVLTHPNLSVGQFFFQIDDPKPVDPNPVAEKELTTQTASTTNPLDPTPAETSSSSNLSSAELSRKASIERCLSIYFTRQIDADILRPWSLMHGLLAYGSESRVITGNKSVSAVDYLCNNGIGDDRKLIMVHNDKLYLPVGPGFQGHEGQLLAMLAQSNVPPSQTLRVDDHSFTIKDLVEYEKSTCRDGTELTFKLIGLSHYLDSDASWENNLGQEWTISRLIEQEIQQPITGAACGGTHRLMGLSYAVVQRMKEDKPISDAWEIAANYITEYQEYTYSLQNDDGSFSTEFFKSRSSAGGPNKRLLTTGHILEWMVFSLPDEDLDDPRLERSVDYLVKLMLGAPGYKLDVGPRGHALRALALYESKVFDRSDYAQLMPDGIIRVREAVTARATPVTQHKIVTIPHVYRNPSTPKGSSGNENNRANKNRRFGRR